MNKVIEFIDFLIISTQDGLEWEYIKPQEPINDEKPYYRVLNPESKEDLITLRR